MSTSCKNFRQPNTFWTGFLMIFLHQAMTYAQNDWNQWRGGQRNGISTDPTPIINTFPQNGLPELWKSDAIPSDHDGGHSSVTISGDRLYLPVVWHTAHPSDKRLVDGEVLASLGYRGTNLLGEELTAKMELARQNMPRLRGAALEEWARNWVKDQFTEEQRLILGSWAEGRFRQGKQAIDLAILEKLNKPPKRPFETPSELNEWLDSLQLTPEIKERVLKAVPTTIKSAEDVVLCLDANSGKTVWKFTAEGQPIGRGNASTCAVDGDRVYSLASTHLYALDANSGQMLWKTPLRGRGSSPLISDGKIWVLENELTCINGQDGSILWSNKDLRGTNASPILWHTSDGRTQLVCQTNKNLTGLDPNTGSILWTLPGGGQATPVTQGDNLVNLSSTKGIALRCYKAQPNAAPIESWTHDFLAARYSASPIIFNDCVFHLGSSRHLCLNLADGKVRWESQVESTISSPIVMDHKLLIMDNNGTFLNLISPNPESYQPLARTRISAMWCPTPTPWKGRLFIRKKDHLACYDLRQTPPP